LHEILNVRFGTMVVGRAMTGKTTVLSHLFKGLNILHKRYQSLEEEEKK
jgi:septin family protein